MTLFPFARPILLSAGLALGGLGATVAVAQPGDAEPVADTAAPEAQPDRQGPPEHAQAAKDRQGPPEHAKAHGRRGEGPPEHAQAHGRRGHRGKGAAHGQGLERMAERLELTEPQQERVAAIRERARARHAQVREQTREQVRDVLTAEQRAEHAKANDDARRQRGRTGGPPGRGAGASR